MGQFRIVGSMTTLPGRIHNIKIPIKSILSQTLKLDVLYIHIPQKTLNGKTYNIPHNFLSEYKDRIIINRIPQDFGPITKLAPILDLETDPNTYIITFDDDIVVNRRLLQAYINKLEKWPNTCLAMSGVCKGNIPFLFQFVVNNKKDHPVDWIQGVHTVMYKRSFFTTTNDLVLFESQGPMSNILMFNDDHRISLYLASRGVPRVSLGYNIKDYLYKYTEQQPDALSMRSAIIMDHYKIIKHYGDKRNIYNGAYKITNSIVFLGFLPIMISGIVIILIVSKGKNKLGLKTAIIFGIIIGIFIFNLMYRYLQNYMNIRQYNSIIDKFNTNPTAGCLNY
jgi:hypothetical protein